MTSTKTLFIQLTAYGNPILFQVREIAAVEPYRGVEDALEEARWIRSIISVGSREPISHEYVSETVEEIMQKFKDMGVVVG